MSKSNKKDTEQCAIPSVMRCNTCKYYESYRDAYFGDEFEPYTEGFCRGNDKKDYYTTGESEACENYSA